MIYVEYLGNESSECVYSDNEKTDTLTKEEKKLIVTALNHFGDYVADHQGYTAGENTGI